MSTFPSSHHNRWLIDYSDHDQRNQHFRGDRDFRVWTNGLFISIYLEFSLTHRHYVYSFCQHAGYERSKQATKRNSSKAGWFHKTTATGIAKEAGNRWCDEGQSLIFVLLTVNPRISPRGAYIKIQRFWMLIFSDISENFNVQNVCVAKCLVSEVFYGLEKSPLKMPIFWKRDVLLTKRCALKRSVAGVFIRVNIFS